MKSKIQFLVAGLFLVTAPLFAQHPESIEGDAGLLFSYFPKEGKEAEFNQGYKEHLQWHRENNDPFVWYGWYVISGDRVGMFIDGTFGLSFEAFDNRVKPREDAAHFQESTAPYADIAYRKVFKHKPELGISKPLEDWNPTMNIEAYTYSIRPGREIAFEEVLAAVTYAIKTNNPNWQYTVYRQISGGDLPTYLFLVHHNGFSLFDENASIAILDQLIERTFNSEKTNDLLRKLSESVLEIHGESWLYRQDLSYFPE